MRIHRKDQELENSQFPNLMTILAVIFDLDGTVLDNEDEYGAAFRAILRLLGKKVDKKFPHIGGIGVKENWPRLLAKYKIKTKKTIDELTFETQNEYLKRISGVTFKKGFEDFISELKGSNIGTALATSNARWIIDEVSDILPLSHFFDIVTTGEEVDFKKPEPDLFLLTAQKLGVEASECLVIEDSNAGIEAAHRAGMKAVGIYRDRKHAEELKDADLLIHNFYELSPSLIAAL